MARASLDAGWERLRDGRWEPARSYFSGAGESAEAYEGLSWAAWWLDDAPAALQARERAYRLYLDAGDPAGAARMATWLAVDQLDFHGAWAIASGWLRRARRLLEPLDPGPDHGWLAFHEGYLAHQVGDTAAATALAGTAVDLGRRFGVPDLEMLGLALRGGALVACADVGEGMGCLDEATATALGREAAIPISSAWTCCFLVSACVAVQDFTRAVEWCDRIAAFADRYGSRYMLAFCRAEYGAIARWRGRWSDAEAMLEASVEDFAQSRPPWVAGPLAGLAELRRRQGRPDDAVRLLERAGASGEAMLCRARMALDRGEPRRAAELAERRLRGIPSHRRLDRGPALDLLVRARAAGGDLEAAGDALRELREVEAAAGTAPLRASADLAEGVLRAAGGEHEAARALLEDAVDGFDRSGAPFEAAVARLELATSLIALGRAGAAEEEAAAARAALLALGAAGEAARADRLLGAGLPLPQLTRREREVLGLLAEGLTNRQLAARLVVSEHTVHRHVANILRKLDVPSRTAAAAVAVRAGV